MSKIFKAIAVLGLFFVETKEDLFCIW